MGQQSPGNQPNAADQQDQHYQRVEKAGRLKINMHVGNHPGQNEERTAYGKHPSDDAAAPPEQNANAKQHWDQRDTETVCAPQVPVGTYDAHLVGKQVSAYARHGAANQKFAQPTGGSAHVTQRTVIHVPEDIIRRLAGNYQNQAFA